MDSRLATAAAHWSRSSVNARTRFWQHPPVLRHVNRLVCGEAIDGYCAGLHRKMRSLAPEGHFRRGISVGCGNGTKELKLLEQGIVHEFHLFEISEKRLDQAAELAESAGVRERVHLHLGDAFEHDLDRTFDLVYWNNSLHHMFDVHDALRWSRERLVDGGFLVMDDFVGPTRFQWTQKQLELATHVRSILPPEYLHHPTQPGAAIPARVQRPDPDQLYRIDPTEAADSSNILPAIERLFPNRETTLTGGVVYHLALNDVIANFSDSATSQQLLAKLLEYDEKLASVGDTHYAVVFATR